jgi:uncharacterized RDD family membrane protein YckC
MDNKCSNHPEKQALSFCHNCGKYYCSDCLNEGKQYYYCNSKDCFELYKKESLTIEKESRKSNYADFGVRFLAYFIDSFIFFILNMIVISISGIYSEGIFGILFFVYFVMLESSKIQATIGKKLMKIVVIDSNGNRISIVRSFIRNISKPLSILTLFYGYLMVAFDKKKQALHDKIANVYMLKLNYELLPQLVKCNSCKNEVELNYKERLEMEFICPECNSPNSYATLSNFKNESVFHQ